MVKPRAPFRYWGAKVRMAPWVIERLPEHDHFVEGCAGSAAIMAAKPPVALETINDTYGEVVNFWRVLRDPKTAEQSTFSGVLLTTAPPPSCAPGKPP